MSINRYFLVGLLLFTNFILVTSSMPWNYPWTDYSSLIVFNVFYLLVTAIGFRSIRRMFEKTIRHGNIYDHTVKSSYDWDSILKKKSQKELKEIASGKTLHPAMVAEMAKKILDASITESR